MSLFVTGTHERPMARFVGELNSSFRLRIDRLSDRCRNQVGQVHGSDKGLAGWIRVGKNGPRASLELTPKL